MTALRSATSMTPKTLHSPDTPGPGPWIDGTPEARIEELEEMLRRIVTVVHPDPRVALSATDHAVIAMACDALGLDTPISTIATKPRGAHLFAV